MADDLTVVASLTRTELSLAGLNLEDPGTYRVVTAGPGGVSWVRRFVESPYMHGRTLIDARKDQISVPLAVRVYAASLTQLETRAATLLRAFEQFTYHLSISIDGAAHEYVCEVADYTVDDEGTWDKYALMAHEQTYKFVIPRSPIPVQGAF